MKKFFVAFLVIGMLSYCGYAPAAVNKPIEVSQNIAMAVEATAGDFPEQGVMEVNSMAACGFNNNLTGSINTGTNGIGVMFKFYMDPEGDNIEMPGCATSPTYPFEIQELHYQLMDTTWFGYPPAAAYGTLVVEIDIECPWVPGSPCLGPGSTTLWSSGPVAVVVDGATGQANFASVFPNICIDGPVFIGITQLSWTGAPGAEPALCWSAGEAYPPGHSWISVDGGVSFFEWGSGRFTAFVAGETEAGCAPLDCPGDAVSAPANDECATPDVAVDGNNTYQDIAATDSGPDHPVCGDNWDDVWYEYTATCSGIATVTANAPDRLIFVYDACPTLPADEPMVCAADTVDFFSAAAATYYIRIGRTSGGGEVCGSFDIECLAGCANDGECSDGEFCTGVETCDFDLHPDPSTGLCVAGPGNPCLGFCDGDWMPCQYDAECAGHGGWERCIEYEECDDDQDTCVLDPCWAYACVEDGQYYAPNNADHPICDGMILEPGMEGGELVSYDIVVISRDSYDMPGPFDMTTSLWTNFYFCDGDFAPCLTDADCVGHGGDELCLDFDEPYQQIAGTECSFTGIPSGSGTFPVSTCDASAGLATGVVLPDKFWMVYVSPSASAGFANSGPAGIGYSGNYYGESSDGGASWANWWWMGADQWASFTAHVCTEEVGVCCYWVRATGNTCERLTEDECIALSGTWTASPFDGMVYCEDPDADGVATICEDNCPADFNPGQEDCDAGITPEGDACEPFVDSEPDGLSDYEDEDGDGQCNNVDPCPYDNPDDTDLDGVCDSDDECPTDPMKSVEGQCDCFGGPMDGFNQETDSDGDGYADCVDACPGVDDDAYPGCGTAIPTVSEWGLVILGLLLLVAGKVYFGRRARA